VKTPGSAFFRFETVLLRPWLALGLTLGVNSFRLLSVQAVSWTTNGTMATKRFEHSATLLPNGMLLVAGGYVTTSPTNSAELYAPTTGKWTPTGVA
jgi:hypothetical protein